MDQRTQADPRELLTGKGPLPEAHAAGESAGRGVRSPINAERLRSLSEGFHPHLGVDGGGFPGGMAQEFLEARGRREVGGQSIDFFADDAGRLKALVQALVE